MKLKILKDEAVTKIEKLNTPKEKKFKCGQCEKGLAFTVIIHRVFSIHFLVWDIFNIFSDVLNVVKIIVLIALQVFIWKALFKSIELFLFLMKSILTSYIVNHNCNYFIKNLRIFKLSRKEGSKKRLKPRVSRFFKFIYELKLEKVNYIGYIFLERV